MKLMRTVVVAVLVVMMLAATSMAAETVKQVVTSSNLALRIGSWNENADRIFEGYEFDLRVFTPEFKEAITVPGKTTTIIVVKNGKAAEIILEKGNGFADVPQIPAEGFLVVGSGAGSNFLKNFQVGDSVEIRERESKTPQPLPTVAITLSGASRDLNGINRGRMTYDLILYTPDFGSHTFTNKFGAEIAVADGVVVAKRAYGSDELFAIPENGFVLSGHNVSGTWVDQIKVGDLVDLQ